MQVVLAVQLADELLGAGARRCRGRAPRACQDRTGDGDDPTRPGERHRPARRGELLELDDRERSPTAGAASRAERLRRLRRGRPSRRPRARRGRPSPSATTRTRARSRCSSRAPTGSRDAATTTASLSRLALAGAALRAPARAQAASWSTTPCAGSAGSRASSSSRSCRRPSRGATATSWSTRSATRDGELVLGFHARGRWDRIDDAATACSPRSATTRPATWSATGARAQGLARLRPPRRARASCATSSCARAGAPASCRCGSSPRPAEIAARRPVDLHTRDRGPVAAGPTATTGALGARVPRGGGLRPALRISPDAFFQTNTEMAERLYGDRRRLRGPRRHASACSTSTAASARSAWRSRCRAGEVWGLEIVQEAIADAIANARRNEIDNAHFFAGDVRDAACARWPSAPGTPDVVVVDPPRAGLSKKVVRRLIECNAARIVYVSCNPTTLAPNAAQIVEAGYRLVGAPRGHVPPHPAHRVRGAARAAMTRATRPAASASPPASTRRSPSRSRRAARMLGYHSMWSNDHPAASGLETIAVVRGRRRPSSTSASRCWRSTATRRESIADKIARARAAAAPAVARHRRRLHEASR